LLAAIVALVLSLMAIEAQGDEIFFHIISQRREQQRQRHTRSFPEEVNVVNMVNVAERVMCYATPNLSP
jgi:hypothetical protein